MTLRPLLLSLAIAGALAACDRAPSTDAAATTPAATVGTADAAAKASQLKQIYADYWEALLKLNPVIATFTGDNRYNDQLPDTGSAAYRQQMQQFTQDWLKKVEAIGPAGLTGQDLLSYEIFVADAKDTLESFKFPDWQMPVNQMRSTATLAVQLGSGTGAQPFKTVKDYDNWLARAGRLPVLIDTEIANMREGMKTGVVMPRALMEDVIPQLDALIKAKPEESLFWGPITSMPKEFPEADRTRLTEAFRKLILEQINPAYRKQRDFIANEYLPKTRDSVGLDKLPDGAESFDSFNERGVTTAISDNVLSPYLVPFLALSFILLAAAVGAIVLARKD